MERRTESRSGLEASQQGLSRTPNSLVCGMQALNDPEEAVVVETLAFLANVTEKSMLQRRSIITVAAKVAPHLLINASPAIRFQAVSFLAAAAAAVSHADCFSLLPPLVKPAFKSEPLSLTSPKNIAAVLNLGLDESSLSHHRPSRCASGIPNGVPSQPHSHVLLQRGVGSQQADRSRRSSRQSSLQGGGGSQGGQQLRQRLGTAMADTSQPNRHRRSNTAGSSPRGL